VPGSHHPQHIDVMHRGHARVRAPKAMGVRNLPSKSWQVKLRLGQRREHRSRPDRLDPPPFGLCGRADLKEAEPG
jgi:hypothetical protein